MEVFHVIKITTAESSSNVGLFLTQQQMLCFSPEFLARANKILMMATSVASEQGRCFLQVVVIISCVFLSCRLWDLEHNDNYVLSLDGHSSYDQNESLLCVGYNAEKGSVLIFLSRIFFFFFLTAQNSGNVCVLSH